MQTELSQFLKDLAPNSPFITPEQLSAGLVWLARNLAQTPSLDVDSFVSLAELARVTGYSRETLRKLTAANADKIRTITPASSSRNRLRRRYHLGDVLKLVKIKN